MEQEFDGSARAAFVRANEMGGDEDQLAAAKLAAVLQSIQVFQPPVQY
jgi:hypothetical protein